MSNQPDIACNLEAISTQDCDAHLAIAEQVVASILETRETEHGYQFRYSNDTPTLERLVKWISNERLCCPFFTFTITVNEELWLELSGSGEVKDFIQSMYVNPD